MKQLSLYVLCQFYKQCSHQNDAYADAEDDKQPVDVLGLWFGHVMQIA